jgi:hypothetical protein
MGASDLGATASGLTLAALPPNPGLVRRQARSYDAGSVNRGTHPHRGSYAARAGAGALYLRAPALR